MNTTRERLLASSILGGAALLAAAVATPAAAQQARATETEVEGIVITGSRIVRQDYEANTPIVTVGAEALATTGTVTVETLLNQMPQFVPSVTSTSNNPGGNGQANVELRGLGSQRTLVLMDGRRVPPSNSDGTVDLNTIPPGLVENIEVITGGASATYGSDAIAGVVNFKLKRHFQGVEADVQYGISDRNDGETENVSLLFGGDFDEGKGNAVLAFGFSNRGSIKNADRGFSSISGPSSTTPMGGYTNTGTNLPTRAAVDAAFGGTPGAVAINTSLQYRFNPDGTLFANAINYRGPTSIDYSTIPINGTYNTGPLNFLVVPLERYNVFARVERELVENVTAYGQFNFTSYKGGAQLAPSPAAGNPAVGSTGFLVPTTNPFIPAQLRTILASRANPTAPFLFNKRFSDVGFRRSESEYDVYQFLIGVRGDLMFVPDWTFDLYIADGREKRLETQFGNVSHAAVRTLLEAPDGGASICAGGYNPFGERGISAACALFISRTTKNSSQFDQRLAEFTVQGPVFELPAGPLKALVGVNYIRNAFTFIPDSVLSTRDTSTSPIPQNAPGVIGFNALNPLRGSTDVYEYSAELLIPLLKDLPFIQSLSINPAARLSDYSTVGSVETYKVDGNWKIMDWASVRGGYSHAIRAPAVGELFAPQNQNFPGIGLGSATAIGSGDPCDINGAYRRGASAAAVRTLCLAQGVPVQIIDAYTYSNQQVQATTGGNPNLTEETANSYTFGLVLNPKFDMPILDRVSASVDYYHIKITDAVGTIGAATTLQNCFNNPLGTATNPTFDNTNIFCALIRRDPATGQVSNVTDTNNNLGKFTTDGIDFQVDWSFGLGALGLNDDYGRLAFNVIGTKLLNFHIQNIPGGNIDKREGTVGNTLGSNYAKWKILTGARWDMDPWSLGARWRYVSKVGDFLTGGSAAKAYSYFDVDAGWDINDNFSLRVGVNNLADKQPPVYTSQIEANTDPSTYDVLGRRFFLGLRARF